MTQLLDLDEIKIIKYAPWFRTKYDILDKAGIRLLYAEDVFWSWTSRYERTIFYADETKTRKIFSIGTDLSGDVTTLVENKRPIGQLKSNRSNDGIFTTDRYWTLFENDGKKIASIDGFWAETDTWEGPLFTFVFKSNEQVLCEIKCHTSDIPMYTEQVIGKHHLWRGTHAYIDLKRDTDKSVDYRVAISAGIFFLTRCDRELVNEKATLE